MMGAVTEKAVHYVRSVGGSAGCPPLTKNPGYAGDSCSIYCISGQCPVDSSSMDCILAESIVINVFLLRERETEREMGIGRGRGRDRDIIYNIIYILDKM